MKYLKNMWYVAAWDYEVTHALMAREILEKQILLYRKTDGQAVAISDVCPHRYAPLHKGKLFGDVVECPYHGLRFNSAGACVHNPHPHGNGPIPRNANVRSYPTLEKYGAIWIWMGEREPDESLIPDYQFISDKKNYRTITGVFDLENHYEMASDNALDLTHVTFTHAGTLGAGTDNVRDEQVVRERVGNTLWCKRFNNGIAAGSDFKRFNPVLQSIAVDKQQNVRWDPPGYIVIIIRYVEAGTTDKHLTSIFAGNLLTPISQTRTRFFWSVSRTFGLDSDALDSAMRASAELALMVQDKQMIEDQLTLMRTTDLDSLRPVYIADDATPIAARRLLKQLIAEEESAGQAAAPPETAGACGVESCRD